MVLLRIGLIRGVQTLGVSGPCGKQRCLGPHIKYVVAHNHEKSHNVLRKFMILC